MSNEAVSLIDRKFELSIQRATDRAAKNRQEAKRAEDEMRRMLNEMLPVEPEKSETVQKPELSQLPETEPVEVKTVEINTTDASAQKFVEEVAIKNINKKVRGNNMDTARKGGRVEMDLPVVELVNIDDVLNLPPVHCQRDTINRYNKAKKHLKHLCEEHLFISVIRATADIEDEHGKVVYKKGSEAIIDGNTRVYHWNQDSTKLIPAKVLKIVYEHDDIEDIADRYYRYDSRAALESAADKVTGYYRENGMSLKTRKFAAGAIATALRYIHIPLAGDKKLTDEDRKKQAIEMYMGELELMDNLIYEADIEYARRLKEGDTSAVKPCTIGQQVLSAMLMELKKYKDDKVKREMVITFIKNYLKSDYRPSDKTGDAVLWDEMHGYSKDNGLLGKPSTRFSDIVRQMGYAILCLESYVSNKNHQMTKPKSFNDEAGKDLYDKLQKAIKANIRVS